MKLQCLLASAVAVAVPAVAVVAVAGIDWVPK